MLMVKIFFCIGRLRDAVACYERAIQLQPDTIENHKVEKINMPMYLRIL
jgi:cytochrome c-type biogenesis protein CcmH/NrfG